MSLFNEFYKKVLHEARERTVPSVAEDQPSYRRSGIEDPKTIEAALKKLKIEELKKLAGDKDNIDLAVDVFNIIKGLKEEDLAKSNLSKGELLNYLLNVTKTDYHDSTKLAENDITGFKIIGRNALMKSKMTTDDKIKLNAQLPRWHNLYDMVYQEIYGKDTPEYRDKVRPYTKRDVSVDVKKPEKIEKAEVYYFDRDPSEPDAKPFRTTIIIPPNDYKTQEEKEQNVPIAKSFWNEPKTGKPAPWPFGVYTPKQLENKTVNQIRDAVNSSDAELAHKALYPPNKHPEMYTMK